MESFFKLSERGGQGMTKLGWSGFLGDEERICWVELVTADGKWRRRNTAIDM